MSAQIQTDVTLQSCSQTLKQGMLVYITFPFLEGTVTGFSFVFHSS